MVLIALSIIAATEFLKRVEARDFRGAIIIVVAAAIGAIVGAFELEGLDVQEGIIAGLTAVGIHQAARQISRPS